MTKIGIILGSTRPGRNGEAVAKWVLDVASKRTDAEFELVDLLDYNLPHLDEAIPPSMGQYGRRVRRLRLGGRRPGHRAPAAARRRVAKRGPGCLHRGLRTAQCLGAKPDN